MKAEPFASYSLTVTDPRLKVGPEMEGLKIKWAPAAKTQPYDPKISTVRLNWGGFDQPRSGQDAFRGDFAMLLEFGVVKDGKLPVGIHVCLPDEGKSVLAGRCEITGLVLASIKGALVMPPAINEKVVFIGSVGPSDSDPLWTGGVNMEVSPGGSPKNTTLQAGGPPGVMTIVQLNQKRGGDYLLRGCKPGWHLVLIGAGEHEPEKAPSPNTGPRFPVMSGFPNMTPVVPLPRIYAARWVELKDDRSVVDCPLQFDPTQLGTVKIQAPEVRDGSVVTFLPFTVDGKIPVPEAHGVSPFMRARVKDGATPTLSLPEGSYEFICLGAKQTVKIERGKTQTIKIGL